MAQVTKRSTAEKRYVAERNIIIMVQSPNQLMGWLGAMPNLTLNMVSHNQQARPIPKRKTKSEVY